MKVLIVASQKGGAGKTTLAAHLAVAAEEVLPKKVVILDGDPQGSLSAWWNSREFEYPALASSTLDELPEKIDQLKEAGFDCSKSERWCWEDHISCSFSCCCRRGIT